MHGGEWRTLRACVVGNNTPVSIQPYGNINVSFLDHLLRDDLINPVKMSVRGSVRMSTMKHNAATNQIVVFVKVDETFTTI